MPLDSYHIALRTLVRPYVSSTIVSLPRPPSSGKAMSRFSTSHSST